MRVCVVRCTVMRCAASSLTIPPPFTPTGGRVHRGGAAGGPGGLDRGGCGRGAATLCRILGAGGLWGGRSRRGGSARGMDGCVGGLRGQGHVATAAHPVSASSDPSCLALPSPILSASWQALSAAPCCSRLRAAQIAQEPSQCLRYCFEPGAAPLWPSTKRVPAAADIPRCERCGAERRFEFQVR